MTCPHCGAINDDGIHTCSHCGNSLLNQPINQNITSQGNTVSPVMSPVSAVPNSNMTGVPQQNNINQSVTSFVNNAITPTPIVNNNVQVSDAPIDNDPQNIVVPTDFKFSDDAESVDDGIPKKENNSSDLKKLAPKKNKRSKKRKIKRFIMRLLIIGAIGFVIYYVYVHGVLPFDFIKDFFFDS